MGILEPFGGGGGFDRAFENGGEFRVQGAEPLALLQPGVGLGFRGDSQKLPLIVENLISRPIGQPLSRLQNPQCLEVKRIVHTGEYATLTLPTRWG